MNRNRCIVCAQCFYISELRRSPRSKTIGAVLLSCLTISDYPGIHTVKDSFDRWHLRLKWICHKHFVDAANVILHDMGISDLQYGLISATSLERQLRPEAISNQLVTFTNDLMKEVDEEVVVDKKDVWRFLTQTLRRYCHSDLWTRMDGVEQRELNAADILGSGDEPTCETAVQESTEPVVKKSRTSTSSDVCVIIDGCDHSAVTQNSASSPSRNDIDDEPLFSNIRSDSAPSSLPHVAVEESKPTVLAMQSTAAEHLQSTSSDEVLPSDTSRAPPRPRCMASISGSIRSITCLRNGLNPVVEQIELVL
ncbi:unnamed protein product [Heligmosomoides polygyrus]|uniref:Uncharacterized protein n=1 Tax=Heligmosomoides polygyrus TaxID=6339 RepID=A0A183GIZ9_HELPZ|nr:unnamed protein product [Heligmosomoides polygyrus]